MTKFEIIALERQNKGVVNLYAEGSFYKAYEQSAFVLCTYVRPLKVSARPLKGYDGLLEKMRARDPLTRQRLTPVRDFRLTPVT